MDIDETINSDTASTTDTNANFAVRISSPIASSSRDDIIADDPMTFLEDRPVSPRSVQRNIFNGLYRRRVIDSSALPNSNFPSDLLIPSSSSDLPGSSTSYTGYDITNSTDDEQVRRIRRFYTEADSMFDEHSADILTPIDPVPGIMGITGNTTNDTDTTSTLHILSESSDAENDDNTDFPENPLQHLGIDPVDSQNNFDPSSAEQPDPSDQLFAPEESSNSSTENSPSEELSNQFTSSYIKFLNSRQNSVDELPLLRTSRYRRFLPARDRDPDIPMRLGSTQRLTPSSYHRARLLNSRLLRHSRADWFSRPKPSPALGVTSNEDGPSLTNRVELRDWTSRAFRRNLLPKLNSELRMHANALSSWEGDSGRPYRRPERLNSHSPALLRSIIDLGSSLRPSSRPSTSNVRARSVSPTSVIPTVSASVHDEPLDDIGINLRSENTMEHHLARRIFIENLADQVRRPSTPLPPILSPTSSDDDIPVDVPQTSDVECEPSQVPAEGKSDTCRQPLNLSMNLTDNLNAKEAPQTYDELNNELIQLLECPICFEYTTPPINQCLQGHIICNTCRQRVTTCPTCRTIFQESRNLIMEKVAALLRYPCKNAVTGCDAFLYLLQKEQHEMACGFRQYACFLPLCNWRGYKPELLVHVQETHENHVVPGPSTNLLIPVSGQTKKVWLMSAFNELFYVIFFTTLSVLKGCVRFIGDCSKCDNYTYNISVTSEEDMLRNFNYTRTTHAYEENFENVDMIDSYDLFSISHAQLNLFRKGTKAPIRVTIEEAQKRSSKIRCSTLRC